MDQDAMQGEIVLFAVPFHFNRYVFARRVPAVVRLSLSKKTQHNRPSKSLNTCCAVIVDGVEIGRTRIVPNSYEPLWAAQFLLPIPRERARPITSRLENTAPPDTEDLTLNVSFEVWNDDPARSPMILGKAALPSGVISELITDGNRSENVRSNDFHNVQECNFEMANKRRSLVLDLRLDKPANKAITEATEQCLSGMLSVSVEIISEAESNVNAGERDSARCGEGREYLDDTRSLKLLAEEGRSVGRFAIEMKTTRQTEVGTSTNENTRITPVPEKEECAADRLRKSNLSTEISFA